MDKTCRTGLRRQRLFASVAKRVIGQAIDRLVQAARYTALVHIEFFRLRQDELGLPIGEHETR